MPGRHNRSHDHHPDRDLPRDPHGGRDRRLQRHRRGHRPSPGRQGFHVYCAARRADRVAELAEEIGGTAVTCDVTDAAQVADLAAAVGDRLDVLVNNAGGAFGSAPVAQADAEQWRAMYEVNVIGLMQVTRALLPALTASGAGIICNVGSTAGASPTRAGPATPPPSTAPRS